MIRDLASLWRTINDGLGRNGDGASCPANGLSAEAFAHFFDQKVADVRSATDGAPASEVRDILSADRFLSFAPVTSDIVCQMVGVAVNKQVLHEGSHANVVAQVLHRPARSLHHVAVQLIAVLRRLSDVLQGRVCHTSPEETDATPL